MHHGPRRPTYNVELLVHDMTSKGWLSIDLAREAKVSHTTVGRFLKGEHQTAPTAKKLARALGRSINRYLIAAEAIAS